MQKAQNYKIVIEKNQGKGYSITITFHDGFYKYELYADTKKEANEWVKNNKDILKKMSESFSGR